MIAFKVFYPFWRLDLQRAESSSPMEVGLEQDGSCLIYYLCVWQLCFLKSMLCFAQLMKGLI